MKKRVMSVLLALCMVLTMLPKAVGAEENAPAPTNLTWDTYGNLSFNASEKSDYWQYNLYRDGERIDYCHMGTEFHFGEEGLIQFPAANWMDRSGKYTIEICLWYPSENEYGETSYCSEWVMSEPFEYTHPGISLQLPTNFSIGQDYIPAWKINEANLEYPGTYHINLYYKRDGEGGWFECASQSVLFEDEEGADFLKVLQGNYQDGYSGPYGVTIRAVSGNINWIGHSEESEMLTFNYNGSSDPLPPKTVLTKSMFTVDTTPETYDGTAKTKAITSSLTLGTDYTVSYANNVGVGTATITITGKGNYSGTVTYNFEITSDITASIWLATHSITLVKGRRACPVVRVTPSDSIITWTSSDPSVASVDSTGSITGVKGGTAQIMASITYGGKTVQESCTVTVTAEVSVAMKEAVTVPVSAFQNKLWFLPFTYRPANATITVTTSDSSVVSVGEPSYSSGRGDVALTIKGGGSATITVTATVDNEVKTAACTVTVPSSEREIIQHFVDTAISQKGNGPGKYGWGDSWSWCARFVYWCADKAGVSAVIPSGGAMAEHVCGKVVEAGGSAVYFDDVTAYDNYPILTENNFLTDNAIEVSRNSYTPQIGDIVFFRQSLTQFIASDKHVSHVGIVCNIDGNNIYVVHGNWGNRVQVNTLFYRNGTDSGQGAVIIGYARPNWSKIAPPVRGKVTFIYHCPINVRYTYDGEVLDSATGQLEASFGTMELNEADDSIKVTLYDYYDVDVEITGNGEGTMDLTAAFEDEDGTTSTRSFQDVPITTDTVGKLYATDSIATAYLELYENEGKDFVEVWTADKNETATEKDAELTDWYTSDNNFGDDEPTPTPTPPSGGGSSSRDDDDDDDYRPSKPSKTPAPTVTPVPSAPPTLSAADRFADVKPTDWFADAVQYVCDQGMMNGMTKDAFSPNAPTSRGMLVTILYRLEEEPSVSAAAFSDVAGGKYYAKAVAWASQNGLVNGFEDGSFRPDEPVTREQIAAILYRYTVYKGGDVTAKADLSGFTDATQISKYAREPLAWAKAKGFIKGTDWGGVHPGGYATRAETAAILMRFCGNAVK